MAGIRRTSDLGTQGVKTILDGSVQPADLASGTITGSGHSNIYSRSTSSTTATVVSAIRTYNNRQYLFTNLTFNMPSNANTDATDWTAPANSSTYKWSYIYIRPSDNKFYISNNAPSAGLNYRTIGGSVCIYLFPIYTSSTTIFKFQMSDSRYTLNDQSATVLYGVTEIGLGLFYDWGSGLQRSTGTIDVTSKIPATANDLYVAYRYGHGSRLDGGGYSYYYNYLEIQDKSNSWVTIHYVDGYRYHLTPATDGAYFTRVRNEPVELVLSTNIYNFAATRFSWAYSNGIGDAYTGAGWWMRGFNDGQIY